MDNEDINPIFLFSLPRAGSTLLQRIIATSKHIATVAEPWVLIPLFYSLKEKNIFAEYNHHVLVNALHDFCDHLPGGESDYYAEVRDFVLGLYLKAADGDAHYFLDKTPRYHLIAKEIIRTFPEGKFIFLWRNPLAIASSMIETWGKGKWNLYRYKVDLYKGMENLIEAYLGNKDNVYSIKYEEILAGDAFYLDKLFNYLGIEKYEVGDFTEIKLQGRMGDPTGTKQYNMLTQKPADKWKKTMANPIRKFWCRRYLLWLGKYRLNIMGYDQAHLLNELKEIPTSYKYLVSDIFRMLLGLLYVWLEPALYREKIRSFLKRERIYTFR